MTTVQPRAAISSSSVGVEPDAVGEHGALAQHPQPVEVGGGAQAVGGDALLDLLLGLGEVDLDRQPALGAELGDPAQRVLADRVDRVRGEGGGDRRPEPGQLLEAAQRRLAACASASPSRSNSGAPIVARRPASATARAVASGCQYMSQKRVVPVRIISAQASRAPQ